MKVTGQRENKLSNVIELGAGLGRDSIYLGKNSINLTALDYSENGLKILDQKIKNENLSSSISTLKFDIRKNLPFENNQFDYIWSWGVIHHTTNTELAAEEIQRVMKKDGQLDIMIYNNDSLYKLLNVYLRYGILKFKFFQG